VRLGRAWGFVGAWMRPSWAGLLCRPARVVVVMVGPVVPFSFVPSGLNCFLSDLSPAFGPE
jgi:hypothetical protein